MPNDGSTGERKEIGSQRRRAEGSPNPKFEPAKSERNSNFEIWLSSTIDWLFLAPITDHESPSQRTEVRGQGLVVKVLRAMHQGRMTSRANKNPLIKLVFGPEDRGKRLKAAPATSPERNPPRWARISVPGVSPRSTNKRMPAPNPPRTRRVRCGSPRQWVHEERALSPRAPMII